MKIKQPTFPQQHWLTEMNAAEGIFSSRRINSGLNLREHKYTRMRRVKEERNIGKVMGSLYAQDIRPPMLVTMTRYSPAFLDDDGLSAAFKAVRDGIADAFGTDDGPNCGIVWRREQVKAPRGCYGIRVVIRQS